MSVANESGFVDNWHSGKSLSECNLHMLTSEDFCDVTFMVGPSKQAVRAHRYVLVSRSCVFYAMFCGPLAEKGKVTLPDIDTDIFNDFLRYLYTNDVSVTAENVTGLMYTSRKYAVDGLLQKCVVFLEGSLCEDNVCQVLEESHSYGDSDFEENALKILTKGGKKITKSEGFRKLCRSCLKTFLKSDNLILEEIDVFASVITWGKEQCRIENLEETKENIRETIGDLRYDVGFVNMPLKYIAKEVRETGILDNSERMAIMDYSLCHDINISPFRTKPRGIMIERFNDTSDGWNQNGLIDAIAFKVNCSVNLLGFTLYGQLHNKSNVFSLKAELLGPDGQAFPTFTVNNSNVIFSEEDKTNEIRLRDPVSLEPNCTYILCVTLEGENCWYGTDGQSPVEKDGIKVEFSETKRVSCLNNGTSSFSGQIPALFFRKM